MKCFPGVKAPRLEHYLLPDLIEHEPKTVEVHVGTNSLMDSEKSPEQICSEIISIGRTAEQYGTENVIIYGLIVRKSPHWVEEKRRKVNSLLRDECEARNFYFISNNDKGPRGICDFRVRLSNSKSAKFARNLIAALHRFD